MLLSLPAEDNTIMISALEHYSYCPRQCALIHREQTYDENIYTLRGNAVHERVDQPEERVAEGVRVEQSLPIWSASLGLTGKADVVEFHGETPYPVEYKHGSVRWGRHADLQLCAQAMCLEEMLGVAVPEGAVYHFTSRRRRKVVFTPELRQRVREATKAIRHILQAERLPPPAADTRCDHCSLIDSCLPFVIAGQAKLTALHHRLFTPASENEVSDDQ
jgi:CRISPR-associated exonuclease Cas4